MALTANANLNLAAEGWDIQGKAVFSSVIDALVFNLDI
jgi:hypothetical protein